MTGFVWRGPPLPENPFNTDDGGHAMRALMAQRQKQAVDVSAIITDYIDNQTYFPEGWDE